MNLIALAPLQVNQAFYKSSIWVPITHRVMIYILVWKSLPLFVKKFLNWLNSFIHSCYILVEFTRHCGRKISRTFVGPAHGWPNTDTGWWTPGGRHWAPLGIRHWALEGTSEPWAAGTSGERVPTGIGYPYWAAGTTRHPYWAPLGTAVPQTLLGTTRHKWAESTTG